ncbi:class I SAM-dependent RNA methyltransferase [Glacieibacterium frigidum]|uniref:Class I SAM-dependent RNA methyltransferase n=1 Tax=Glacieibacterium frigidum TaxID=2593303 RepID=A0A552UI09_9SPHN|nr:class I SAM-dependent RNA methyltransferase [Glacieibacterium frigidum]TRW17859.1 class I SAM-dependent RNA methyltransferase [Glacieibacterium frigidum]
MSPVIRIGARGDGVTADGRFVPFGVPGDTLADDGTLVHGPDHQDPPCRHFPECGGCQLQHVADPAYADWAVARIVHALGGAGVTPGEVMPVHLSPPRSRRRASLRGVKRGGQLVLGFNAEASHRIVDIRECHVLLPGLFALVAPLRGLLSSALKDGQGAGVTLTMTTTGIDLLLSNVAATKLGDIERLTAFADAHDLARLSVENEGGVETIAERRAPLVRLGGVDVALPPAAFLQATEDGEAALVAAVLSATRGAGKVADLFAGLGTFALPLSNAARVLAADAAGPAMVALKAAAIGRLLLTEHRDLFRNPLTVFELDRFDTVVFDPPRAGAAAQVALLAQSKVPCIVAVSCNPSTFARDAALLTGGGYRLEQLWPVGQFRWSTHVELVARFVR